MAVWLAMLCRLEVMLFTKILEKYVQHYSLGIMHMDELISAFEIF